MCCSKRYQQQGFFQPTPLLERRARGCGTRQAQRQIEAQSTVALSTTLNQPYFPSLQLRPCHPMAALFAVSIGMGAEKLGRKISDKRLERKEQRAAKVVLPLRIPQ